VNSLISFSSSSSSYVAITYLLYFGHSFLVQGVYGVMEHPLSSFFKAETVQFKCTSEKNINEKNNFKKYNDFIN
jgi:hypothetical protein